MNLFGSRVKKFDGGGIMGQIPFMTGFKVPDAWNQWQQHKLATNLMKEDPNTRDYHQMGGHDFMQRFPNTPDWLGKGLATGYQLASEFGKGILNPSRMSSFLPRALEEARLNRAGIDGLTPDQQARYDSFSKTFNPTIESMYPTDKLASLRNIIGTEFGGSAEAAEMPRPINRFGNTVGPVPTVIDDTGVAEVTETISPAKWSMRDDLEAQNITPTFDTSDEEQDYYNQIRNKIGGMPTIKDPNILQRMFKGLGNIFRGAGISPAQQGYINRYGRNPTTGRMSSGPFQGQNLFGTSMFGSKTAKEQALKNLNRWGKTAPDERVNQWENIIRGDRAAGTGTTVTGHGKSGMGRDPSDKMAYGGRVGYNTGGRVGILSVF